MSKSFSETLSILRNIFSQKISRIISIYTVDTDLIGYENNILEEKISDLSKELVSNRDLMYFMYITDTTGIPDNNIDSVGIRKYLHKHLTCINYKNTKWIHIPIKDKCIFYQSLISDIISKEDEKYICFITTLMNKAFPDLLVKVEDEDTDLGFVLRVKVFWA